MKNIFLDTNILIKIIESKSNLERYDYIEKVRVMQASFRFVFSLFSLYEIITKNIEQSVLRAQFIDSFRPIWFKEVSEIRSLEIEHYIRYVMYKEKDILKVNPYCKCLSQVLYPLFREKNRS